MIRYTPNVRKILNVILWLTNERPGMDMYWILKVIFLAEKWHLNTYGRPIAGETYLSMDHGPVAETAYGILRRQPQFRDALGGAEFPFTVESDDRGRNVCVFPSHPAELSEFSNSELKALRKAQETYGHLSFDALRALTHRHPAYERAWAERGDKRAMPIRYEDLLEGDNADPEVIEDLAYAAQFH